MPNVISGFDLPIEKCDKCNKEVKRDGQDLNIITFLGLNGEKMPDIDLNVSPDFQLNLHKLICDNFKKINYSIYRSGTILEIQFKNAMVYMRKFFEHHNNLHNMHKYVSEHFKIMGCKTAFGKHPGGLIVSFKDQIRFFTPFRKINQEILVTQLTYNFLKQKFFKLDILGHEDPKFLNLLFKETGLSFQDIDFSD